MSDQLFGPTGDGEDDLPDPGKPSTRAQEGPVDTNDDDVGDGGRERPGWGYAGRIEREDDGDHGVRWIDIDKYG